MSVWAKRLHDGTVSIGATITAPSYTLTAGSQPVDGWVEYADEAAALAAFGVTDDPVGVLQGQVAQLSAQLAALLGEDVTP